MPITPFKTLPGHARVWVFGSDRALADDEARAVLDAVDAYLAQWKAHGQSLRCGRDWVDGRFLAIGVDPTAEQASGCSIDGMFRRLRELEQSIGARLVGGGRVFYRGVDATVRTATRAEFSAMAARGDVTPETIVFDTTVTSAADWRDRFARRAGDAWTAELLAVS
jgi:hypothetical protein